jgi:sulfoxide reductase heme-binding subunit YedZ
MLGKIYRVALLTPIPYWVYWVFWAAHGPDPAKTLNHKTGDIALYYLLGNLAIGVLIAFRIRLPSWLRFPLAHRRFLGVLTFVVLVLHVLLYLTMEGFARQGFVQLVTKLYLILGFSAFLILFVMALTSNDVSVRRLGFRVWKRVHRFVYLASALVTVHVLLIEKIDKRLFGVLFVLLWLAQGARAIKWIGSGKSAKK